jgi:hypothetical protein
MDFTGTLLGVLTIPMALLNAGSGIAGLWLILRGDWSAVLLGALLFAGGTIIAPSLSRMSSALANIAGAAMSEQRRAQGYLVAFLSSAWPVLVILIWEVAAFYALHRQDTGGGGIALWIWSYGVATGVWSWQAHRAESEDRTLKGIQAYSAQIAYVVLSTCLLLLDWPLAVGVGLMLLPMILPLAVGMLLALADRDALRDVRI